MVIIPPSSYSTAPRKKLPLPNLKDVAKISPSSPSSSPSSTTSGTAPLLVDAICRRLRPLSVRYIYRSEGGLE
ncbi:Hypothetical predicted protein [Olea europaea subsp. europaea]|uniref:Uncharacterized protein n=1 Tax=Olea europaea subsp. europaea TaxID=158383 RepID=A0A8S0R2J1_OLEEU|nr:Hypothetical predicted protein [Olea europaea subsp. europaea]